MTSWWVARFAAGLFQNRSWSLVGFWCEVEDSRVRLSVCPSENFRNSPKLTLSVAKAMANVAGLKGMGTHRRH
jgi:hypothetical protein